MWLKGMYNIPGQAFSIFFSLSQKDVKVGSNGWDKKNDFKGK